MQRYQLSTSQWRQMEGLLTGRPGSVGVTAKDNRKFVNGVLWVLRSGAHWNDLPDEYGNWKSVHKRFTRWARAGLWERICQVLPEDSDHRYVMIDSTIVGPTSRQQVEKNAHLRDLAAHAACIHPSASEQRQLLVPVRAGLLPH